MKKIDVELAVMFGRETITQAASMDLARVSAMDCKAVAATAKEIRRARGYPKKQVKFARALVKTQRLLLYRWLQDPDLGRKLSQN